MELSTMQPLPNTAIALGYAQTEDRLSEMSKNLEKQADDLNKKVRALRGQRTQLVANDYSAAAQKDAGLVFGDTFYLNGYSVPFTGMECNCDMSNDPCLDPDWLAIPEDKRPGFNRSASWSYNQYRYSYNLSAYAKIGQLTTPLANAVVWRDNGMVAKSSSQINGGFPTRCSYPVGSHYPLRGAMSSALQGAKIKLAENDRDYEIDFRYAAPDGSRSKAYLPVDRLVISLPWQSCTDLRMVANHQNQYNKLLALFEKRCWLDSHEYKIDLFSEESSRAGQILRRTIIFNFKMVEPKKGVYQ